MSIENDTPIIPWIVADTIVNEVFHSANYELPPNIVDRLAEKAEVVYKKNVYFRRKIQSDDGRDILYAFMRHWLAAIVKDEHPKLSLPKEFAMGKSLMEI